nr:MAG TPA: hypothetical protein [Caudoviricetes sp.]
MISWTRRRLSPLRSSGRRKMRLMLARLSPKRKRPTNRQGA